MPPRTAVVYNVTRQVGDAVRRRLGDAVLATAARVERAAKAKAPVDTGSLRNSIQHRQTGPLEAEVEPHAEYAAAVEFGTGVHSEDPEADRQPIVIEPREKKALSWPGAAHPVRRVVQQGQPPQPYLVPAVDAERDDFVRACEQAVEDGAHDAGGRDTGG